MVSSSPYVHSVLLNVISQKYIDGNPNIHLDSRMKSSDFGGQMSRSL